MLAFLWCTTEEGYEILSKQLWKIALAEVPPDDLEFAAMWGALVQYCNTFGSDPSPKTRDGFSEFPDPHDMHPSTIPAAVHTYLNKLWCCRKQ